MSEPFAFSFTWSDDAVAGVATADATPATPPHPRIVDQVSQTAATRVATPPPLEEVPETGGFRHVWDDLSQVSQDDATPVAKGTGGCDTAPAGAVRHHPVASVASVANWRSGVESMDARRPLGVQPSVWRMWMSDAAQFLRCWGDDAIAAGWSTLEIFGTESNPAARRLDRTGLVPMLRGRPVQALDAGSILIGHPGSETTFYRLQRNAGGVPIWMVGWNANPAGVAGGRVLGGARKRLPPNTRQSTGFRGFRIWWRGQGRVTMDDIFDTGRWCILRTGGGRTLPLTRSLVAAGIGAWSPVEAILTDPKDKVKPVRIERPIMPTFVFAKEEHALDLLRASVDPTSRHPSFSIFRRNGPIPFIGMKDVRALREAEEVAEARFAAAMDGRLRDEERMMRVARLQREAARRKALRSRPLASYLSVGTWIEVQGMPAMAGLPGQIVEERGTAAVVMFGGTMRMTIEAWQIVPSELHNTATRAA